MSNNQIVKLSNYEELLFDLLINKIHKDYDAWVEVYGVPKYTSVALVNSASKFIPIDSELLLKKDIR